MNWTEERIALLRKLWADGHSASRIGKELGVSKNAVVGKAHRIKLPPRPSPIKSKRTSGKGTTPQPAAVTKEAPAPVAGDETAKTKKKPVVAKTAEAPKKPVKAPTAREVPAAETAKPPKTARTKVVVKANDAKTSDAKIGDARSGAEKKPAATRTEKGQDAADCRLFSGVTATPRTNRGPKCLWPVGDPGDPDFHFCDAPSVHGKPYCAEHCARAYITKTRGESTETGEEEVTNSVDADADNHSGDHSDDHGTHEATS